MLDTHALLWWLSDDPRLGSHARKAIEAVPHDTLFSDVSLWEVVIKIRIGKLTADLRDIEAGALTSGFTRVPIDPSHLHRAIALPLLHRDPFDHLLMAQAIAEDATFMTADRAMAQYPLATMACR